MCHTVYYRGGSKKILIILFTFISSMVNFSIVSMILIYSTNNNQIKYIKMRVERKQTLESNIKRSIANRGKKRSEETKQKISSSLKEYWAKIPYSLDDENKIVTNIINEEEK